MIVFICALACRVIALSQGGGITGIGRYDDGVYFAAATNLVFGRLPYRDFILLHPPGIVLGLSPFALLGRVWSDTAGLIAARAAFLVIGALNAALVSRLAARQGRRAGLVAGLVYAFSYSAIYAETTVFLEGLTTLCVLAALVCVTGGTESGGPPRPRRALLTGILLALGAMTKIWGIVPALVVLGWLWTRSRPAARALLAGLVCGGTVTALPFLLAAPAEMTRYVLLDQLGRPRTSQQADVRILDLLGAGTAAAGIPALLRWALVLMVLAGLVAAVRRSVAVSGSWLWAGLLVASLAVLLQAPSYFPQYGAFVAPFLALVLGHALGRATPVPAPTATRRVASEPAPRPARTGPPAIGGAARRRLGITVLLAVLAGFGVFRPTGHPFDASRFRAHLPRDTGCVAADDPTTLVLLDVLSEDLRHGCRVWVDVTGLTYDRSGTVPGRRLLPRRENTVWQEALLDYLRSSDHFVLRREATGITESTLDATGGKEVLVDTHGARLFVREP